MVHSAPRTVRRHRRFVRGVQFGVRPWYLRWGTERDEATQALAGDEIIPDARAHDQTTRAIRIYASADRVWPWLAQLGQDRAGFYSYGLLEKLVGCSMPSADRIHPEFQAWETGDKLWMYPPERVGGLGHALLVRYEPGRVLVFATRQTGTLPPAPYDGSWAFVLEPIDQSTSRLAGAGARGRSARLLRLRVRPFRVRADPFRHGAQDDGGHQDQRRGRPHVVGLGFGPARDLGRAFLLMLLSALAVLRGKAWDQALAAYVAACVVFQLLTFLQPSPLLGASLVIAVAAIRWMPRYLPPTAPHQTATEVAHS